MPTITLVDGTQKSFSDAVTVHAVAADIGPGLAKAAVAGVVDQQLVDTTYVIDRDVDLRIVTLKDEEGIEILRHSAAHLLAHAVKHLFPSAKVAIGPVIENGFYYDFDYERGFVPEDMEKIEKKMAELAKENYSVERREITRAEALKLFTEMDEALKVEIINEIPEDEMLTVYQQGDFIDLCRGPHLPNTGLLKAVKLTKLSGAYWRGDSNNKMLQRVYGTAWPDKKQLNAYIKRMEEAEKRDHRKLAKKMDLFHQQPEAPGMAFWHPNGWTLVRTMRNYLREVHNLHGYKEINTPQMVDVSLWEQSGHLSKFGDEMFTSEFEHHQYAIKPMNCPCHVQVYKQGVTSYRDLPIRYAEFGNVHRNEPSGTLHGLMRARNFVQDDAHIFCTNEQIHSEVLDFIKLLHQVYRDFGFTDVIHKLSTRPEKRVGSDEEWDKAEYALEEALNASGVDWEILPGEGAFYGPKIEFSLRDCIGRIWQCGTIQVDFSMPRRLEAHFIAEDGSKQVPVMLHRAVFGSFERFVGILLEHYDGRLPLWLAPVQAAVLNITDRQYDYAADIAKKLQKNGIRAISDLRNEKIGFKIREHTIARVPYLLILGDREMEEGSVAVRGHQGDDTKTCTFEAFCEEVLAEVAAKTALTQKVFA